MLIVTYDGTLVNWNNTFCVYRTLQGIKSEHHHIVAVSPHYSDELSLEINLSKEEAKSLLKSFQSALLTHEPVFDFGLTLRLMREPVTEETPDGRG